MTLNMAGSGGKAEKRVITCAICFGVMQQPISFDCNHSYCMECVQKRLSNRSTSFQCLLCDAVYSPLNVDQLHAYANEELEAMINRLSRGYDARFLCQWCEEVAAELHCQECMCAYCADCSRAVHRHSAKREHSINRITDEQQLRGIYKRCSIRGHEEYHAEFFCIHCEQLCCAYCLQVGPHKGHENTGITRAAAEARQRMGRDLDSLEQIKSRAESQANELNRTSTLYFDSYDSVENMITERFAYFKQQLMQRELELRRTLANLRASGDASLMTLRKQYVLKLNGVNEFLLRFQRLQNGGADYEVLESRSQINTQLREEIPVVSGSGFKLTDLGDMQLSGLDILLDIHRTAVAAGNYASVHDFPTRESHPARLASSVVRPSSAKQKGDAFLNPRSIPPLPLRLSFPVDDEVEAIVKSDGLLLRCTAQRGGSQIGVRSKELFQHVLRRYPEDGGIVSWRIRLEQIKESFLGIVEKSEPSVVPEGFYWKVCTGDVDGRLGRQTSAISRLPLCRNGDVIQFTYESQGAALSLGVNDGESVDIVTELNAQISACCIFFPGEAVTILF